MTLDEEMRVRVFIAALGKLCRESGIAVDSFLDSLRLFDIETQEWVGQSLAN